jgi:Na+/proline symporter
VNWVLAAILGYVALQLAIGVVASRRVKTEADYLIAGRSLGGPVLVFTVFATWFGAETCVGAAGEMHEAGLAGGSADPFGYAFCLLLFGLLFAVPLRSRNLMTLADLFRQRFSPGVERLAAIIMIPTSVFWAAAQVRAFGQVLAHNAGFMDELAAVSLATGVVLLYTLVGGLLADAWTDVVQGILLMIGLAVLGVIVIGELGGVGPALAAVPREKLALVTEGSSLLDVLNEWAVPVIGSVTAQELVARVVAAKTPRIARRATVVAAGLYLVFGLIPVFIGLVASQLVPGELHAERVLPAVAEHYLSTVPYVLFAGVLVSAILSTVDSTLLVAGSLLSHNVVAPLVPGLGDRGRLRAARAGVFVFGLCAWGLALGSEDVAGLVEEASGFGSAGVFVITAFGLFTRVGRTASAAAALWTGLLVWIAVHWLWPVPADYMWTLAAAVAVYVGVAALTRTAAPEPALPG